MLDAPCLVLFLFGHRRLHSARTLNRNEIFGEVVAPREMTGMLGLQGALSPISNVAWVRSGSDVLAVSDIARPITPWRSKLVKYVF